ncbi:MAG: hypothetical protein LIO91_03650 [Bacteroidales bacterium]|nr:hypothetical protein [Bacteroidales bacterium]
MAKKRTVDFDKVAKNLFRRTEDYADKVRRHFATAVDELLELVDLGDLNASAAFSFADSRHLSNKANKTLRRLYSAVYNEVQNGVKAEWGQANLIGDALIESIFGKGLDEDSHFARWFSRNQEAMDEFLKRKSGKEGLGLSQRIWRYTDNFRTEMETAISVSLGAGDSADVMSRKVCQYLENPDDMFRRFRVKTGEHEVRDARGNVVLDADGNPKMEADYGRRWKKKVIDPVTGAVTWTNFNPRDYHTGPGVYRSSYKNAMRLTRTETNMAYRTAEQERWKQLDFVVGYEVKCSNNHPEEDICDYLAGKYPKNFVFRGWHPQCRCYCVPILNTEKEFIAQQKAILQGEEPLTESVNEIDVLPKGYTDWLKENQSRFEGAYIAGNGKLGDGVNAKYTEEEIRSLFDYETFKKRGGDGDKGRTLQGYIGELQGFNDLPSRVSPVKFSDLEDDDNYVVFYRGYRKNEVAETKAFKTGKLYEGKGGYGDGQYFAEDIDEVFGRYSETKDRDIFLSGALDKRKAKIGDYFELQQQWTAERKENPVKEAMSGFWGKLKTGEVTMADGERLEAMRKIYEDFGAWATMKGYDAYYVKNDRYWVVLNRTKLIMRDAEIKPAAQVPYFIRDNAATKFKQQPTAQEIAAKRHAARTAEKEQSIRDAWNKHNQEIANIQTTANNVLKLAKDYGEVDYSQLESLVSAGKVNGLQSAYKDVGQQILKAKKFEQSIGDLVPNAHDWHKRFTSKQLQSAHDSIQKTLNRYTWDFNDADNLNKLKGSMAYEVRYMETKGKKHITWEVARDAYKQRLALVEHRINMLKIKESIAADIQLLSTSKSSKAKKLVTELDELFKDNNLDLNVLQKQASIIKAKSAQIQADRKYYQSSKSNANAFKPKSDAATKQDFINYCKSKGISVNPWEVSVDNGFIHLSVDQHEHLYDKLKLETYAESAQLWNHRSPGSRHGGVGGYIQTGNSFIINSDFRKTGITGKIDAKVEAKLRACGATSDDIKTIKLLDKKISEFKTPFPMRVTRYVELSALDSIFGEKVVSGTLNSTLNALIKSKRIIQKDPAYLSASTDESANVFSYMSVKLEIEVPPGTPMYLSNNYAESEVVFGRSTAMDFISAKLSRGRVRAKQLVIRLRMR